VDLLLQSLSQKTQTVLRLIGNAVFVATGLLIIYQAPGSISQFSHHSQVADLPMNIVHLAIPGSFIAIVILLIVLSIREIQNLARGGDAAISDKPK
jgi:TRAP-type C4-dicarboxylate transport system permease small subunit